jgi:hypothetical protein
MKRRNFLHSLLGGLSIGLSQRVYAKILPSQSRRRLILQESPLAGFQYHRASAIWPFLREGEPLHLKREPTNPHDRHAVAVWFRNEHLGYVPRRENRTLATLMDQGERPQATLIRLLDEENPWRKIRIRVELIS